MHIINVKQELEEAVKNLKKANMNIVKATEQADVSVPYEIIVEELEKVLPYIIGRNSEKASLFL